MVVSEWEPQNKRTISVVACNGIQVLCATGNDLFYIEILCNKIVSKGFVTLQHEVACLNISPLNGDEAKIVAVGLWTDISVRILTLPNLEEINKELLGGEIIPRSILMTCFESETYLLCALGDGSMYYFTLNRQSGALSDKKKVTLGTQPTVLRTFRSLSTTNVFACSDRPTVIYSSNHKLVFNNVNLKEMNHMCSLSAESYPDSLALATDCTITIGTIDKIQKLHIRTVPLGETPESIAYQESSQTFGVITTRINVQKSSGVSIVRHSLSTQAASTSSNSRVASHDKPSGHTTNEIGQEIDVYKLLIIDQHTFEVLHAHTFMPTEYALSLVSTRLGEDPTSYFVVGTVLKNRDETGRILLYHWSDGKFTQVAEKEVMGSCRSLEEFSGKLLANINSTICLFEWTAEKELRLECSWLNNIKALFLENKYDFVVALGLMQSVALLQHRIMKGSFEKIVRDLNLAFTAIEDVYDPGCVAIIDITDDENLPFVYESRFNLITLRENNAAMSECKRQPRRKVGEFYLCDRVNIFRHDSLVMQNLGESSTPILGCVLFGTISGAIGLASQIPFAFYEFLRNMENRLNSVIKTMGKIKPIFWRSFNMDPCKGFIDGDLIESFLDLSHDKMTEVATGLMIDDGSGMKKEATVDDLVKIVEDLTRIH